MDRAAANILFATAGYTCNAASLLMMMLPAASTARNYLPRRAGRTERQLLNPFPGSVHRHSPTPSLPCPDISLSSAEQKFSLRHNFAATSITARLSMQLPLRYAASVSDCLRV